MVLAGSWGVGGAMGSTGALGLAVGVAATGVVVGDLNGERYKILHRFDNSNGAKSWRVSHPHPYFSADGKRLYFNVSAGKWTELYVAEWN